MKYFAYMHQLCIIVLTCNRDHMYMDDKEHDDKSESRYLEEKYDTVEFICHNILYSNNMFWCAHAIYLDKI